MKLKYRSWPNFGKFIQLPSISSIRWKCGPCLMTVAFLGPEKLSLTRKLTIPLHWLESDSSQIETELFIASATVKFYWLLKEEFLHYWCSLISLATRCQIKIRCCQKAYCKRPWDSITRENECLDDDRQVYQVGSMFTIAFTDSWSTSKSTVYRFFSRFGDPFPDLHKSKQEFRVSSCSL